MDITELFDGYVSRTHETPKVYFETEDEVEEAMIQAALFQTFDDVRWEDQRRGRSISTFGNNLVIWGDYGTLYHTQLMGDGDPEPLRMSDVETAMGNSGSLEGLVRDYIEYNFTPEDEALLHGMTLNNHDVMLNPDGSVKVGCTEVPVEKLDKIAEASRRMRENQQSDEDDRTGGFDPWDADLEIGQEILVDGDRKEIIFLDQVEDADLPIGVEGMGWLRGDSHTFEFPAQDEADEWVELESHPLDLDLETGQPIRMDGREYTLREIDPDDRKLPLKLSSYGWAAFSQNTFEVRKEDM